MREEIIEHYGDTDNILFADGFDDCIIGFEPNMWKVVYSRTKCIESLIKDGMDMDASAEYLEFNTFGAYMGKKTPIWVEDFKWNI